MAIRIQEGIQVQVKASKHPLALARTEGTQANGSQLAEAGWKFAPTIEDEDMTVCPYCLLGLSGWEPGDKAM